MGEFSSEIQTSKLLMIIFWRNKALVKYKYNIVTFLRFGRIDKNVRIVSLFYRKISGFYNGVLNLQMGLTGLRM